MGFTQLSEGPGFQVGRIGSLLVTVHTQAATTHLIRTLDSALEQHRSQFPRFSVLALVSGGAIKSPESGLKDLVVAQEKRFESAIIGAGVAIEAKGLSAVLTRTFLAAYTLLSSHSFPVKSFGTTEQAVTWLQALPGQETYFAKDTLCAAAAKKLLPTSLAA
ncbi:MAG: hypothetical protein QM817_00050 [Archangium sp.]